MPDGPGRDEETGAWRIKELIPDRAIVYYTCRNPFTGKELCRSDTKEHSYIDMSWVFVIKQINERVTRLLVSTRVGAPLLLLLKAKGLKKLCYRYPPPRLYCMHYL